MKLNRHLMNLTPTLTLPLKGRAIVMFLPQRERNACAPPPSRGRLGGGWDLAEQYNYVSSIMASLVT